VPLRVLKDGKVLVEKRVELASERQQVDLEFVPDGTGFQTYNVEIPLQPGNGFRLTIMRSSDWLSWINRFALSTWKRPAPMEPTRPTTTEAGSRAALPEERGRGHSGILVKTLYCEQFGAPAALNTQVAFVDPKRIQNLPRPHPTQGFPQTLDELLKYT